MHRRKNISMVDPCSLEQYTTLVIQLMRVGQILLSSLFKEENTS